MRRLLSLWLMLLGLVLLSGCGTFPRNPALGQYQPDKGYRFKNFDKGDQKQKNKLFVILSFSGGGTRAAALSYGVLEGLEHARIHWEGKQETLLDEVDVISSISGGSFTAAYYGLYRDKTFIDFPSKFLYQPIQSDLVKQLFNPVKLMKLGGSSYGRSDLAFEFYNNHIFNHATFDDMTQRGTRPFISINATDMTLGSQFSFTQYQFDQLCSDLDKLPVARAVAASSAFPGLLTPLTFENYHCNSKYPIPTWVKNALKDRESGVNQPRIGRAEDVLSYLGKDQYPESEAVTHWRPYIHLIDGGVADNIGLRDPLVAITSVNHPWSVMRLINKQEIDKLVVIVVNAATNPATKRDDTPDVPGLVDTLTAAATIPLDNYSFDTVQMLKSAVAEYNEADKLISGCIAIARGNKPSCHLKIKRPYHVELYPIVVSFDKIKDRATRTKFKNLPTTFELPKATVDSLIKIGQQLLKQDAQYKRLMKDIGTQ